MTSTSGYVPLYTAARTWHKQWSHYQLADPDNIALGKHIKQSQGTVQITAKKDGRYEYCFSNQMSTVVDKMVRYVSLSQAERASLHISYGCSFNVHGVIYVDDEGKYSLLEGLKRSNLMAP